MQVRFGRRAPITEPVAGEQEVRVASLRWTPVPGRGRCRSALGRKLHGGFAGEILNEWKRRWPGARVKHWMKGNWIKMYDQHGCVLRVETVINDPYEFKVRRRAGRRGRRTLGWHPLPKGVAFLPRYAAVSAAANHR
jgi:hypothetical protein